MPESITAYREKVIKAHRAAFELHREVATVLEDATKIPRKHPTAAHIVVDMLMIQALKSHATVSLLAQHGLMEDTATIGRRLLELSVQAVFIGAESEERMRQRKAGQYLAFMWRQLPPRIKQRLPVPVWEFWSATARSYGRFVPRKAKTWGPNWREMFTEVGAEDLYVQDYSFLSAIAHGRPDNQIFVFSQNTIRVHSHQFASVLLVYASRYYLTVAEQWNRAFSVISQEGFDNLVRKVTRKITFSAGAA